MIGVTRAKKPRSLSANAKKWTKELLYAIKEEGLGGAPVRPVLWKRYDKPDVRKALKEMYGSRCCYCEQRVSQVAAQQIEHRKPKAKDQYPEHTYDWDNLHLACPKCNGAKSNRWDDEHPILDAVDDAPIEDHLTYRWRDIYLRRSANTGQGTTTIDHADLNRVELEHQRTVAAHHVLQTIATIKKARDEGRPVGDEMLAELRVSAARGEYQSMIRWALQNYL